MPVKGKTTTRTAKSSKKGPKLKWWYILPVIAIVAVAGYAIVRYSQASVRGSQIYRKVGKNVIANRVISKSDGTSYAIIGNGGFALTEWPAREAMSRNLACWYLKSATPSKNWTAVITLTSYIGDTDRIANRKSYTYRGTLAGGRNLDNGGCLDYARTGKLRMQVDGITNGGEAILQQLLIQSGA